MASTPDSASGSGRPMSVLITGTSQGSFGGALAAAFARRGFTVFATARNLSKIDPALILLPHVHQLQLDVTSPESISHAVQAVRVKTDGRLNFLINNAGAGYTTPMADVDIEIGKKIFDVNFWGVLSVTKAFIPLLVHTRGTVLNVSSVGGLVHAPWIGIYSSSKAALTCASETLRLELAPFKVNVITSMLGAVDTNFHLNTAPHQLPEDSMYNSVSKTLVDADAGKLNPAGTDVKKLAERVIGDILTGATGEVFRANMSTTTKWMSVLAPSPILDGLLAHGRGLDLLQTDSAEQDRGSAMQKT